METKESVVPEVAAPEVKDVPVAELYAEKTAPVTESAPATETTESAVSTEVESSSEPTPTLKDRVAELGFKDVADDNEAQQRLFDAYQQRAAMEEQYRQQAEMLRFQVQSMLAQQQGQQAPVQQQDTQQGWWNAPKTNEQFRQQYIAGKAEDGSVQWKPNTPQSLIAEYEQEQVFYADWANKLVRDPVSALAGFKQEILAEAQRQAQDFIAQQTQQQQANTFVEQQLREHEDVFYQKDPVTKDIRRDWQGQPLLTEAGVRFDSILNELASKGLSDETARWKYAQQIYKAQFGDFKQQATQKMQQAREAHVARTQSAVHIPARNGQDVNGRTNGGRPHMQSFGERFFAGNEFSLQ